MVLYVLLRPIGIKVIESLFPLVDSPVREVVQMGARKEPNAKRTTKTTSPTLKTESRSWVIQVRAPPRSNLMAPLRGISIGDLFDLFCTTAAACGRLIPFSTREHFFFFEQDTLVAVSTIILYSLESTIASIQLFEASFHSSQHC